MARVASTKTYATFVQGIVTEASPLTFPENASIDEANFLLFRDGSRSRRLGMNLENNYAWKSTGINSTSFSQYAIKTFVWENAANINTLSIGVVQVGPRLYFVDLTKDTLSTNWLNGGNYVTVGVSGKTKYSFAAINGWLIVATGEAMPKVVQYNNTADTMSVTTLTLQVRDIWGVYDGLAIDKRPSSITINHRYNLYNQGWGAGKLNTTISALGVYPSNADIWILGKNENDNYSAAQMNTQYFGTTPAPKGRYILDAFNRGASRRSKTGLTSLSADKENGFPSCVAAYAGRIFYSGVESSITGGDDNSPSYQGAVFYTKMVEKISDLGKCYQEADPTSENVSELVDTDGGVLFILEASDINHLAVQGRALTVFSKKGVWYISGTGNVSTFIATDYGVAQVTNVGNLSRGAVVNVEGNLIYLAKAGIYGITADAASGDLQAANLVEKSIQTLINDIDDAIKVNMNAVYDELTKTVRWLYTDDVNYDGTTYKQKWTKELVLDTVLNSFYINTISAATPNTNEVEPYVADYLLTANFVSTDDEQQIVVGNDDVQVVGVDVVHTQEIKTRARTFVKYLTFYRNSSDIWNMAFSLYRDNDFIDWASYNNGADYSSYLVTGYELQGDTMRDKQVPYIFMYMRNTENDNEDFVLENKSSCLIRSRWEWTGSSASNRWGQQFQAYRKRQFATAVSGGTNDDGYDVVTTKSKLRGKGKAVNLKIESEAGKECHIYGWAMGFAGTTVP